MHEHRESSWQPHVLANLRRYNRQYTGFVVDGHKYIVCVMNSSWDYRHNQPDNRFAQITDGWWTVVRVIFDAEQQTVVHLECNGDA